MRANPMVPPIKHLRALALVVGLSLLAGGLLRLPVALVQAAAATVNTCDESHLLSAISAAGSTGIVTFSCSGVITLSGPIQVSQTLTLDASGWHVTLDGGNAVPVIQAGFGGNLTLVNLTVAHGSAGIGGAVFSFLNSTVTLNNTTISGNIASVGGGILSLTNSTLTVTNSTISGNTASVGGGIFNVANSTMTVTNSTISGNTAIVGAGVLNVDTSTATLTNSTISGNKSDVVGGGIYNDGTMTLTDSTISGNRSDIVGGGIYNDGTLTVINSTISGNSSDAVGGGIYNDGTLTVINSTISGNSATQEGGGIYNVGTLTLANSIVAGNTAAGGMSDPTADCSSFAPPITDQGYNVLGLGTGCMGVASDVTVPPATVFAVVLGPLAANGGPTQTRALLPGSPAIDLVPASGAGCPATDQRGTSRPQGRACDAGAFEAPGGVPGLVLGSITFTLSISITGCGTVTPVNGTTVVGNADVTMTPCLGSTFLGWTGGPCSGTTKNPCNVNFQNTGPMTAAFSPVAQGNNVLIGPQTSPPVGICPGGTTVRLGGTCP